MDGDGGMPLPISRGIPGGYRWMPQGDGEGDGEEHP
jgi:hypothetical protein